MQAFKQTNLFLLPFKFFLFPLLNYYRFVPSLLQQSKDIILFSDHGTNMLFYLTTLNFVHVLKEECPKAPEQPTNETFNVIKAWKHSNFLYRNYILNGLVDSLYNVYSSFTTTRGLWEALEKKYKTEDVGTKKFIVGKF